MWKTVNLLEDWKAQQKVLERLDQLANIQQSQVLGPTLGSQQPHAELQAGARVFWTLPSRKGPSGGGQQRLNVSQECVSADQWHPGLYQPQGSDCPFVLGTAEAIP